MASTATVTCGVTTGATVGGAPIVGVLIPSNLGRV